MEWISAGRTPLIVCGALAALALVLYAVLFDNGALLLPLLGEAAQTKNYLHELFHDGRHVLGVPCH